MQIFRNRNNELKDVVKLSRNSKIPSLLEMDLRAISIESHKLQNQSNGKIFTFVLEK